MSMSLAISSMALSTRAGGPGSYSVTFGALTPEGEGAFAVGGATSIASGDASGHWQISSGNLTPSATGDGNITGTYELELNTGASVSITVEAGAQSAASTTELTAALANATLGTKIRMRNGFYNYPDYSRYNPIRNAQGGESFDGTNYVDVTADSPYGVTFGTIEMRGSCVRLHQIRVHYPLDGDGSGNEPAVDLFGTNQCVEDCQVRAQGGNIDSETTGTRIAIRANEVSGAKILNNAVSDAFKGIVVGNNSTITTGCEVKDNTLHRIMVDSISIGNATGCVVEGNYSTDKLYGYTRHNVVALTAGATTTVEVADTADFTVGEPVTFTGLTGTASTLNGTYAQTASINAGANTVTLTLDSTGLVWGGGGEAIAAGQLHGDHLQFADSIQVGGQDNMVIRANTFLRGAPGGFFPGGQGIFGNKASGNTNDRDGWLIEGNRYCDANLHFIALENLANATVRNNTGLRVLGFNGSVGGQVATINTPGSVVDNVANAFGGSVSGDVNSATVTLTAVGAVPANATDVATYEDYFQAAATQEAFDRGDDVGAMFTPRTGGPLDLAIVPGAVGGAFDQETRTWTDPRPDTGLFDFAAGTYGVQGAGGSVSESGGVFTWTQGAGANQTLHWNIDGELTNGTFPTPNLNLSGTFTVSGAGATDDLRVITSANNVGSLVRYNSQTMTGITAGPSISIDFDFVMTVDSDFLLFKTDSPSGARTVTLSGLTITEI